MYYLCVMSRSFEQDTLIENLDNADIDEKTSSRSNQMIKVIHNDFLSRANAMLAWLNSIEKNIEDSTLF